jgi:hypothetical protein
VFVSIVFVSIVLYLFARTELLREWIK